MAETSVLDPKNTKIVVTGIENHNGIRIRISIEAEPTNSIPFKDLLSERLQKEMLHWVNTAADALTGKI